MHANSFGIFYERVSYYGSIMCEDFPTKLLTPQEGSGRGSQSGESGPEGTPRMEMRAKSLRIYYQRLTHLDTIFCAASFFLAICFQYFAREMGGGGCLGHNTHRIHAFNTC